MFMYNDYNKGQAFVLTVKTFGFHSNREFLHPLTTINCKKTLNQRVGWLVS